MGNKHDSSQKDGGLIVYDFGRLRLDNPWNKFNNAGNEKACGEKTVRGLYKMIEIKDMKTATHCKAVAYYSVMLGKRLGLKKKEIKILHDAALVHDIGKVMVDSCVIYKQSRLTENEFYSLRSHPTKGMQILEAFHLDDSIVDAAWHHHERWDGAGYPNELKGEEIRFMTQIISVCDTLDAMSTNRTYRKALSLEEIFEELDKARGTQLAPEPCEKMMRALESGEITLMG